MRSWIEIERDRWIPRERVAWATVHSADVVIIELTDDEFGHTLRGEYAAKLIAEFNDPGDHVEMMRIGGKSDHVHWHEALADPTGPPEIR